jgi:Zn-dependent peptidase ImmA (M78 family)
MARREQEDYERIARKVRRLLGFEYECRPDAVTTIFKAKSLGWIDSYVRMPVDALPHDEAKYDETKRRLDIREDVFCGANRNEPRHRMTIWHELGHIVMGHKGIRHRSTIGRSIEQIHQPTRSDEIEAKRFAAAFAAPAYLVEDREPLTAEFLKDHFLLSGQAAAIRLDQILELRRRSSGAERDLPKFVIEFLKDAQRRGNHVKTKLD